MTLRRVLQKNHRILYSQVFGVGLDVSNVSNSGQVQQLPLPESTVLLVL
jgi:hypothetical protein